MQIEKHWCQHRAWGQTAGLSLPLGDSVYHVHSKTSAVAEKVNDIDSLSAGSALDNLSKSPMFQTLSYAVVRSRNTAPILTFF